MVQNWVYVGDESIQEAIYNERKQNIWLFQKVLTNWKKGETNFKKGSTVL